MQRGFMSHSSLELYLHIIFSTKNRDALIAPEIESKLYGYLGGIARARKCPILQINGVEDHLHLLLKMHADVAVSVLLRELKSHSTGWLKKQGHPQFSWQIGYNGSSCCKSHIDPLIKYIENQKEHHKIHTFNEELARLNRIWGTSWNP